MALINCPECGKEISDKAGNCSNCGCPIQPEQETKDGKGERWSFEKSPKITEKEKKEKPKKKSGCLKIILIIVAICIVIEIIGSIGGDDEKDSSSGNENQASTEIQNETQETQTEEQGAETPLMLDDELSQFQSEKYAYIKKKDLNTYAVNMPGEKVYVVTQVDDIKDGMIQSTLGDGYMMSNFYVGDNYSKYEKGLSKGDTIAIAGVVSNINDYSIIGTSVELNDCIVFAVGDEAKTYKKDSTAKSLSKYLTVTEDVANINGDISEEDYKDLCEHLDYEDILREPDAYDGKYCVVDGTVDQIIEGWFGSFTIFVVDEDGNKWGCTYSYDEGESRVLEGDNVTMYGKCQGTSNTETVLGEQVTLPHVDAKYID